jgi:phytoene/squalene synthetase
VRNIYALVRVADEIVDGAAAEALQETSGIDPQAILDQMERDTYRAMDCGFSSNLIIHAFATTARQVGIERDLVQPFFTSMRMDLNRRIYDQRGFDIYVYGSAEVVGLMCLKAFLHTRLVSDEQNAEFVTGARALGAAFQKVNFLRDLAADFKKLGRSYFPQIRIEEFTEAQKLALVQDIDRDLATSRNALVKLPMSSRRAVAAAQMMFTELNAVIKATPAERLIETRVRVSNAKKLAIFIKAWFGAVPR